MAAPYYDCDNAEPWTIYWYSEKYLDNIRTEDGEKICPTEGVKIVGCARYMVIPRTDTINPPKIYMGSHYFIDKYGFTPLEHEIEHIKCRCAWEDHP